MGFTTVVAPEETAVIEASVARLVSRGVDRRRALRRVAVASGTSVRYVRQRLGDAEREWA